MSPRNLDDSAVADILGDVFSNLQRDDKQDDDEIALDLTAIDPPRKPEQRSRPQANHQRQPPSERPPRRKPNTETIQRGRSQTAKTQTNIYLPARTLGALRLAWDQHDLSFSELVSGALKRHGHEPASDTERLQARRGRRKDGGSEPRILRLSNLELRQLDHLAEQSELPRNRMVVVLIDRVTAADAEGGV